MAVGRALQHARAPDHRKEALVRTRGIRVGHSQPQPTLQRRRWGMARSRGERRCFRWHRRGGEPYYGGRPARGFGRARPPAPLRGGRHLRCVGADLGAAGWRALPVPEWGAVLGWRQTPRVDACGEAGGDGGCARGLQRVHELRGREVPGWVRERGR